MTEQRFRYGLTYLNFALEMRGRCIMPKSFVIALFGALFCSLAFFSTAASAAHLGQTKTVDGVAISE